jgi:hypothetical protein
LLQKIKRVYVKPEVKLPVLLLFAAKKAQKAEGMHPKKVFSFQVHYGHSKGNTPDGEKPEAGSRTLKIEYHSLGQNNETSVTRGPVIKKTGWLKKPMWSVGASPHLPRCIPNPTGVEDK